ncbi:MAG: DUF4167 domain-containing protein [Sphingorhabdus sp.]
MNNRQNNRRRGRGNNRQQNNRSGGVDHQNRIDSRARGNASQMLDKFKKLANDAQLSDDRVNAEYYLQFADHYFRVLADFRARQEVKQEEHNARRHRDDDRDRDNDRSDSDNDRSDRDNEKPARVSSERGDEGDEKPKRKERSAKPRSRKPREVDGKGAKDAGSDSDAKNDGIDLAVLPPAISSDDGDEAKEKPKRKPRARRPKSDDGDDGDVATAAE